MKKVLMLTALVAMTGMTMAQTKYHEYNVGRNTAGWIYLSAYNTPTQQCEYLQGFPSTHFGNFTLDGVYTHFLDGNPSTQENITINIRKSVKNTSGQEEPDMTPTGIVYSLVSKTKKGTGTSRGWVSEKHMFPKSVVCPKGTFWIGILVAKKPTSGSDHLYCTGANLFTPKTIPLCGTRPRQGVKVRMALWNVYDTSGKPSTTFASSTYFHAWYCIGLLTKKTLVTMYSNCPVQVKTKSTTAGQWCPANKNDYTYSAWYADLMDKEGTGRKDRFGWKLEQNNLKTTGNTTLGFIFLSGTKLPAPITVPGVCDWYLMFGGAWWGASPQFKPLTQGKWELTPVLDPPPFLRSALIGTWLFAQGVYVEVDKLGKLVTMDVSNCAGMSF